ncbi:Protein SHORT-ROOT [Acorus calamus]|uniref:Protein SHORT-ROOT n=1 Tax=Acorus calamus TaxID=4465 RepID=A0AAV9FDQ8_ACOCL|nr:Protein SHORT-ROOT [Acorus calamus]
MDTLFRLVSLHQSDQSFNSSSRTSSSSRSTTTTTTHNHNNSKHSHHYPHQHHSPNEDDDFEEEQHHHHPQACYLFMDEDNFSSSSSKHHLFPFSTTPTTPTTSNTPTPPPPPEFSYAPNINLDFTTSPNWSSTLLIECGRAFSTRDLPRSQHLLWALNELSSPYGDSDQKLSHYFLQALFSRMSGSGHHSFRTLHSASERTSSFDSTRKMVLKFQEVSPYMTFGHVASNGAILEAFDGEPKLHIIDFSNTYCTQWPTLLEALATRNDDTPHLRITTVVFTMDGGGGGVQKVTKEIGARMEKFARLMGVPFKFRVVYHSGDLSDLNFDELGLIDDEALAINCVGALHTVSAVGGRRDALVEAFRRMNPKVVTVVEDEADFDVGGDGEGFMRGYGECLRWFKAYFECLDECFQKTSNERLVLERRAGRALVDLLACPADECKERRETSMMWSRRIRAAGFAPAVYSDDVSDDVRALLRRYREGWTMSAAEDGCGVLLAWKEQPMVWACAWKP